MAISAYRCAIGCDEGAGPINAFKLGPGLASRMPVMTPSGQKRTVEKTLDECQRSLVPDRKRWLECDDAHLSKFHDRVVLRCLFIEGQTCYYAVENQI